MKRILVIGFVLAAIVIGFGSAAWGTTYGSHYGVCDKWGGGGGTGPLEVILQDLGAKWIRCAFDWDDIETADNVYDWTLQDSMINAMVAIGVNPYIDCSYTPAWARSGGTHATPPTNPAKYTEFLTVQVNRYKDRVKYWGFWNEPNLSQFYSGTMSSYINNLLIPGIQAVKAADPTAKTVVGELATVGDDVGTLQTMLQAIDAAGLHNQVDVVCIHAYGNGDTPSGRVSHMDAVHNMMVNIGWSDKDFWCTESGLTSSPGGETNQANMVIGMVQGMDARPWWKKFFWFTMTEGAPGQFGLIRPDYSYKPSFTQYKNYIAQHADDEEVVTDTIPTTMIAGQQYPVTVTMKNTGTTTWSEANLFRLGTVGDSDPFYTGRVLLNGSETIAPDQSKVFSFTMTAPATPGTYTTDWQMVHEAVHWFGHILLKTVQVTSSGTNNAQYIADTIPATMNPGGSYPVTITMKNTGTTTWTYANNYKLGDVDNYDVFYPIGRVELGTSESIAPNAQKVFSFTMTAPTTPGTYTTDWQMVREYIAWFGGTLVKSVQVGNAISTLNAKAAGTITIDGATGDWSLAQFTAKSRGGLNETGDYAITGFDGGTCYYGGYWTGGVLPTSATDHTAKVYSREDATYVYYLVRCDDSDMRYNNPTSANWLNDCVEFFIDPSHNHGSSAMSNSTSDIQLDIDANNQKNVYMCTSGYTTQILNGVTSAVTRDATGWWLEVRITKTALDPDLPGSGAIGLDLCLRDNDNNNDAAQTTVYSWRDNASGGGFPSKVPDRWGDCVLP